MAVRRSFDQDHTDHCTAGWGWNDSSRRHRRGPNEYVGRSVTVEADVEEVFGPRAFALDEDAPFAGGIDNDLLVLTKAAGSLADIDDQWMNNKVRVTGTVGRMSVPSGYFRWAALSGSDSFVDGSSAHERDERQCVRIRPCQSDDCDQPREPREDERHRVTMIGPHGVGSANGVEQAAGGCDDCGGSAPLLDGHT